MTSFTLASSSLRHRPLRTIVTILSVTIALAMLTVTMSASRRIGNIISDMEQPTRLLVTSMAGEMPFSYVAKLQRVPGVQTVEYARDETVDDGKGTFLFGITAATKGFFDQYPPSLYNPSPALKAQMEADRQGIIVTGDVLEKMHWKAGDTVTFSSSAGPITAHVLGRAEGSQENHGMMHFEYVNTLKSAGVYFMDAPCPSSQYASLADAIDQAFADSDPPVMAIPAAEFSRYFMAGVSEIPSLMERIGIFMACISLLVTGSTLAMSMRERQHEFGTLRALGFTGARVFRLIALESVVTCVIGGLIGCGVPYLLFHSHGLTLGGQVLENVTVPYQIAAFGLGVSVVLGLTVAILPGLRTARMNVVSAIQDHG